jgi:hypothetical protein
MPTGYTGRIAQGDDVSGNEFILDCARGFGALIHMRDKPSNESITIPTPSNFHLEKLEKAEENLKRAKNITLEEAEAFIKLRQKEHRERHEKQMKEKQELQSRYEKTLQEVKEWVPPTDKHEELKEFAIQQLEDSIEFDCRASSYLPIISAYDNMTPENYIDNEIKKAQEDIEYHEYYHEKEVEKTEERAKWIKSLLSSLEN